MRKWGFLLVLLFVSLQPVATTYAQYEGTDARYAEERRSSRSNRGMIKLIGAGVVLVIAGGAWVYKKATGKE